MSDEIEKEYPFNAGDPEEVARQAAKAARFKIAKSQVLSELMGTVAGRAWVYDLLVFCNVFGNPFVQGSADGTAFGLGQQNVGKMILDEINTAAPERYLPMLREARQRDQQQ